MADETRRLIRVRDGQRARFRRYGRDVKKRLAETWRKPKGRHNKLRRKIGAKGPYPRPGYGSPAVVRGLHPSGYEDIVVATPAALAGLDPNVHAVRIAAAVGGRKRAEIRDLAEKAGFRILNPGPAAARKEEEAGSDE
ncbi:MAG: 50S ribosomal protein L32e [Methanomicrobiales archaeon]|nr:50S ribosomal protein L32e [Methanomicrobiales archaeon]MDD1660131.1 50S ribosomal protein L32e [Methanomicrobiales archaeon]